MSHDHPFTKENLDTYLKEVAKEYRKINGKTVPAEIVLIGGASILVNYGFREVTYDMDAIITASSAMKQAINNVGDRLGLPNGWLNADFMRTKSYSEKLLEHAKYYRTFSKIVSIRTISKEYLIAMKLMSGRVYKNDLSDVIGIITEEKEHGKISLDKIKEAITELYGSYDVIPERSKVFIEKIFSIDNLSDYFEKIRNDEIYNRNYPINFEQKYPDVLKDDNLMEILEIAKTKNKK